MPFRRTVFFLCAALSLACVMQAQSVPSQAPPRVSLCDILKDPKSFDGKLIQFRARTNLEFEDFSAYDVKCNTWPGIWLMFGGDVDSLTTSTVKDVGRPKGQNVRVVGVEYPLLKDEQFDKFYRTVTARGYKKPEYRVTATFTGTFLAGRIGQDRDRRVYLPGYGHLGCCFLFVISQVSEVKTTRILDDADEKWATLRHDR
jgi:hypothetical protein